MRALRDRFGAVAEVVLAAFVLVMLVGLFLGYRPVVLTTDSMSPAAPAGSLLIVDTIKPGDVEVGDILVMKRRTGVLLTHRVVELDFGGNQPAAITKGDANEARDPRPYVLDGDQRVSRFVFPGVGSAVSVLIGETKRALLILFFLAVAAFAFSAFGRVEDATSEETSEPISSARKETTQQIRTSSEELGRAQSPSIDRK